MMMLTEEQTVPEDGSAPKRALPSGTVSFVFTDIQGSTKLFHALGDGYLRLLDDHHEILRGAIARHGGVEVKTEGDAFFVAFSDPSSAALACVEAQRALADHSFDQPVKVRMGIHTGPVAIVDDDYVGLSVHEAARIAGAAHGGQILVSEDVASAVVFPEGLGLRDLGRHALKDFPEPRRLYQVTGPGLEVTFPPPSTLTARSHNLPAQPTALVGRRDELLETQRLLLGAARLVTITGGGGFGKSRLAIDAAWSMLSWFREGVWFVPLAAVEESIDIVPTINRALGITDEADKEPTQLLIERLSTGPTLLVLDNLEQLGDGVVVVADLLAACPELCVLASSRERLRLRGEIEVPLDGLTAEEAISLFGERAEAHRPCADLTDPEQAEAVAQLVALLDGIPLAIELSAALVREHSPVELVSQFDKSLELLTEGERDLPARQRTLRSTIAWSYDLLDQSDRRVFDLFAVFGGGAPLPALAEVAQSIGIEADEKDVAVAAERLADKALVRRGETRDAGEAPRWWVLETIRQFAGERLAERPTELSTARSTHARWFAGWVAEIAEGPGQEQGRRFDALARDVDNLRLALGGGTPSQQIELTVALSPFWEVRGHWREGSRWLDAIDLSQATASERCRVLLARARLDHRLVALSAAEARLREARSIAIDTSEASLLSRSAAELAEVILQIAAEEGMSDELAIDQINRPAERMTEAKALLDEAVTQGQAAGDEGAEAAARSTLAKLVLDEGDAPGARDLAAAALELHRRRADRRSVATTLHTLASAYIGMGDHSRAAANASAGVVVAHGIGDSSTEGALLWVEAISHAQLGEMDSAFALSESSHEAFVAASDDASAAGVLFVRGLLARAAGNLEDARSWMLRSAEAWRAFGDERRANWCEDAVAQLGT